jgi:hypothetical protein
MALFIYQHRIFQVLPILVLSGGVTASRQVVLMGGMSERAQAARRVPAYREC